MVRQASFTGLALSDHFVEFCRLPSPTSTSYKCCRFLLRSQRVLSTEGGSLDCNLYKIIQLYRN
jgi:hypothetical protein